MNDKLLLPCPFCGGKGAMKDMRSGRYHIHCDSCAAQIGDTWGNGESQSDLIAAWNSRAHSAIADLAEELEKTKKELRSLELYFGRRLG